MYILAANFAAEKHRNQRRKDTDKTPYINHPIEVAAELFKHGVTDENVLSAALLHDTVEDTDTTPEEIAQHFGPRIMEIVMECTDDKSLPKVGRKKAQIEHALVISREGKLVKLADKYSNCKTLATCPPIKWSKEVVEGYALWCFAVVRNLSGVNEGLESKLFAIFSDSFGISRDISEEKLQEGLEHYYKLIEGKD